MWEGGRHLQQILLVQAGHTDVTEGIPWSSSDTVPVRQHLLLAGTVLHLCVPLDGFEDGQWLATNCSELNAPSLSHKRCVSACHLEHVLDHKQGAQ